MKKIFSFGLLLILSACKTYEIPVESFREQFKNVQQVEKIIAMHGPTMFAYSEVPTLVNNLDSIRVIYKKGQVLYLENAPSLIVRFFDVNNKYYTMYFDSVLLKNDTLTGDRSRMLSGWLYEIPFSSIKKIKIQDDKKIYKYKPKDDKKNE